MKLTDLALTKAEQKEERAEVSPAGQPDPYNWGLNFRLEQEELDKLGIAVPGLGDEFYMVVCAKVTSVNQTTGAGEADECCVGLQIQQAAVLKHESAAEEKAETPAMESKEMKSLLSYFK